MGWPLSIEAQQAIAGSFVMDVKCTVYSPIYGVLEDLPISGGQVDSDATSQVRRTGQITADPRFWNRSPGQLLSPFGSAVQIYYGIGLRSGDFEYVPLAYLSIDESSRERPVDGGADIPVKLVDFSQRVAEDRFDAPTQTVDGATAVAEIARLVRDTLGPGIALVDLTGSTQIAPVIEIERERWADGVEKLADAIAGEAFFDQINRLTVRPQPTLADPPAWSIRTGPGGNLLRITDTLSRDGVYNRFIASGQRSDGAEPVYAVSTDTDPASPTYWGGPFGKKSRFMTSPLLTDEDQCQAAADAQRERGRGVSASISMKVVVNPALADGDVLDVQDDDAGRSLQIIDKLSTPLEPETEQSIVTRAITLPSES
ncbi:DUF5047 domain-containing protein [Amycolatopsis sp. NPDC059657]|uniref:DUF5047 domain-containing protein n=1 Tax=Amycolatopsis sp. NPDC059657 TaxID=3346899 RepID=UPI00366A7382